MSTVRFMCRHALCRTRIPTRCRADQNINPVRPIDPSIDHKRYKYLGNPNITDMGGWNKVENPEEFRGIAAISHRRTAYKPRTWSIGKNIRPVKTTTGLCGLIVEPYWWDKMKIMCFDILETVREMPEGWQARVKWEAIAEDFLECLEEVDPSDWKTFEDQMKLGPVEYTLNWMRTHLVELKVSLQTRPWDDGTAAESVKQYFSKRVTLMTYGVPEYDEVLTEDEKKWVRDADAEFVASITDKHVDVIYQTTGDSETEVKDKILARRKKAHAEFLKPDRNFSDTPEVL